MERRTLIGRVVTTVSSVVLFSASLCYSSNALVCSASAVPLIIHSEGLAERMGDIVLSCSGGTPGAAMLGNLTIDLGVNVTNKLGVNNTVDAQLTVDTGSGPSPFGGTAQLTPPNTVTFNGIAFILCLGNGDVASNQPARRREPIRHSPAAHQCAGSVHLI